MDERPVTHQNVHLARGAHVNPGQGACVMELASMLAGESFSDRPRSVCPVIADFLRAYNDAVDDDRRQDLYPVASAVVGTVTADQDVWDARVHLIAQWGRAQLARRRRPRLLAGLAPIWIEECQGRGIGTHAVRAVRRIDDDVHASALTLVERLIAAGGRAAPARAHSDGPEREAVTAGA